MGNGIQSQEMSYWSREIAELLSISDSTLRRYCLILEQNGYDFLRDDQNRRAFLERDVIVLRKFQELAKSENMTFEDAAVAVISASKVEQITDLVPFKDPETSAINPYLQPIDEMTGKLQELVEQNLNQQTFNRILLDRIQKQEVAIQNMLKETKKLIATQEEEIHLERQKRITNMITQKRVESKLELEALELWQQKPESERMKKVGFFRKEEDREKKEWFIRVYINNHFEERLKQEFILDNLQSDRST